MNKVIHFEHPDYYENMDLFKRRKHEIEEEAAECLLEIFKDWYPDLRIKGSNDGLKMELKDCTYFESSYTTAKSWAREMLEGIREKGLKHELLEVGPPTVTMYPMESGDRCLFIGVSIMVNHSKKPLVEDTTINDSGDETCEFHRKNMK